VKYSSATVGNMQLDDYVRVVPAIYGVHDKNRSIWDVWCHTLHHGAAIAERIRKNVPPERLFTEIADFSLWLFTFVHKLSGGVGYRKNTNDTPIERLIRIQNSCSDIVWYRYPGVCHLCYARRTAARQLHSHVIGACDCNWQLKDLRDKETKRADSKILERFGKATHDRKPKTIDAWQMLFGHIFGEKIRTLSLLEIGFHLLEELGEVSDAMVRMYSYTEGNFRRGEPNWRLARLEGQIADVFSWLFAVVEKLNEREREDRTLADGRIQLSGIIWQRYGADSTGSFRCPACDKTVCGCRLIFVPATRSIEDLLRRFNPPESRSRRRLKGRK
jgi:NTP pyrophosphatase (non-canonical NTP hydrolase)